MANGESESPAPAPVVRQRIVQEATRLFALKGYNGVSVREIVEAAGITRPTLYYYFASKEQLFEHIITDTLAEFRRQLEQAVRRQAPMRDRLIQICRVHLDFARCNTDHCHLVHRVLFANESTLVNFDLNEYFHHNMRMIADVLAEGITSGDIRAGDPWLMAMMFGGVIHMFIMAMVRNPSVVPQEGLAEMVVDNLLHGFGG
ncbi:MAG: TetR/AcrR family transcriptional regulator [Candidatus Sumerlaeia bacterium]|nr:TetR/AcrR family transcriptional regulator [Candidatus Sumerlaeia bacterium]